jgi:hypothetical protein
LLLFIFILPLFSSTCSRFFNGFDKKRNPFDEHQVFSAFSNHSITPSVLSSYFPNFFENTPPQHDRICYNSLEEEEFMTEDFFHHHDEFDRMITPPVKKHPTGLSIAALILGIVAILGSWIPFINVASIIMGILALIFGIASLSQSGRKNIDKGFPITGIVLGSLTLLISVTITILVFSRLNTMIITPPQPNISYELKTEDWTEDELATMTFDEFIATYQMLADDFSNLAEIFPENPYDITVNDQIIILTKRWETCLDYLYGKSDDISDQQYQQVLEADERIEQALDIFDQEDPEVSLPEDKLAL